MLRASTALGLDAPLGDEHNPRFVLSSNRRLLVEMDPNDPHLNADGLRDREYAVAKPPDTVRIAALGDSVTYGHSVELDQGYTKQLEVLLNADADVRFEVINFGVGGYNTRQELEHFKVKARRYSPDLLLIGYTMNDVLDTETFLQVMGGQPAAEEWSFRDFLRRSRFAAWVMDRSARVDLAENPGRTSYTSTPAPRTGGSSPTRSPSSQHSRRKTGSTCCS